MMSQTNLTRRLPSRPEVSASATRLANTGAGVRTIQEFSGHQSIAMVMRYVHAQDEIVNRALDDMEGGTIEEHPASRKSRRS